MTQNTVWFTLFADRDKNGFPIGFMTEMFATHPPKLFNTKLNTNSSRSYIGSHSNIIPNHEKDVIPFFFAGNRFDISVDKNMQVSSRDSQIGFASSSYVWNLLDTVVFHPSYIIFGENQDVKDSIKTLSHIHETAIVQCEANSNFLCTSDGKIEIEEELMSSNVKINVFTSKWILPREFENEIKRALILNENYENIPAHTLRINLFTQDKKYFTILCDVKCYTRQVNPFESRTLWIDFVDENVVGIPTDFIQDQSHALHFRPHKNEYDIMSLNKISTDLADILHVILFFLCTFLIWKLTHVHSFHSNIGKQSKNQYKKTNTGFFYHFFIFFSIVISLFSLFITQITWQQLAITIYLVSVLSLIFAFKFLFMPPRYNIFSATVDIFLHQVYSDLLFQGILSILYIVSDAISLIAIVIFQLIMTFNLISSVSYTISKNQQNARKYPLLLLLTFIQTIVITFINITFYSQPQLKLISGLYTPNTNIAIFNFLLLIISIVMGIGIRTFMIRSYVSYTI
jgi:hypothetical protein